MRRVLLILLAVPLAGACAGFGDELACRPQPAPKLLSETGCYADIATATLRAEVISYELNAPAWGDGAFKRRGFFLPHGETIGWRDLESWEMPLGAVLVKEFFEDEARTMPIETRFLVRVDDAGVPSDWKGTTYRWRDDGRDAVRVGEDGEVAVVRGREWAFPSRAECARCHNPVAGGPLGLQTPNVNRGAQLDEMRARGLFGGSWPAGATAARMAATSDPAEAAEARARAWLHTNCSHCHREGAEMGYREWGPWWLPLEQTDLCAAVTPGNLEASLLFSRVLDAASPMPPIATLSPDPLGVQVLASWIDGMPACAPEVP